MESLAKEHSVQIIRPVKKENERGETVTSYKLEKENLQKLLCDKKVEGKEIVVISVTGPFRTGKSFFLNYLLLYLQQLEREGKSDCWLQDGNDELIGFRWRRGADPETAGIMAWNKIFLIPNGDNKEVGVLLLDTQGAFDDSSDVKDVALIFALSTMISSCQIYNLRGNLQSDNLQHLQLFTEFGRQAMDNNQQNSTPFQKLIFLIRDWNLDDSEGYEGGEVLLKKRFEMTAKMNEEKRDLRKHIKSCFENIEAFLLPHPGDIVRNGEFKGETSLLHPDFIRNLRVLVPSLVDKPCIKKDTSGNALKASELIGYFERYTELFQSEEMPEMVTILEATAEVNHYVAVQKAIAIWKQESNKLIPEKPGYLTKQEFGNKTEILLGECIDVFNGTKRMLSAKYAQKYRADLTETIHGYIQDLRKLNDQRRAVKIFQTPLVLIISVLICWFAVSVFELLWLKPLVGWINIISMFLIFCIILWVVDEYQGGLGLPIQENIDVLSDELKEKLVLPAGKLIAQVLGQPNLEAAISFASPAKEKPKNE